MELNSELDESDEVLFEQLKQTSFLEDTRSCDHLILGRRRAKKELLVLAQNAADRFWGVHVKHLNGDGVEKEFGSYRVRVMEHGWSLYIQWFEIVGRGAKFKPMIRNIKVPVGASSASMSLFKGALPWELVAIREAEEDFELIRRASEHLKTITRSVGAFEGLQERIKFQQFERSEEGDYIYYDETD